VTGDAATGHALRVAVDRSVCQTFGRCAFLAPEVFHLTDEYELEYDDTPDLSLVKQIEEAVDACPTRAITMSR